MENQTSITIHQTGNGGFIVTPGPKELQISDADEMVAFKDLDHSYSYGKCLISWVRKHFNEPPVVEEPQNLCDCPHIEPETCADCKSEETDV
jgi:hypothetical protein